MRVYFIALASMFALTAYAQDVPKESLSQAKGDTELFKAQAAEKEAARLAAGLPAQAAGGVAGSLSAGVGQDFAANAVHEAAPEFIGVFGPPKATYERVRMPDGNEIEAQPGLLPGGRWKLQHSANGWIITPVGSQG